MSERAPLLAAFLASRPTHPTDPSDPSDPSDNSRLRAQLTLACLPLVESTARGFLRRLPPQIELSELESAGHLGLIRAVDTYDPSRGATFSSWATTCIRGAIRHELEDRRGHEAVVLPLTAVEQEPDLGPSPFALALAGEQKRLLAAAIARLPERWRQVIEGRFYDGRDYTDIGRELGVCGSRVKQIEGLALERLRKALVRDAPTFVDEAEVPTPDALPRSASARAGAGGSVHA